MDFEAIIPGMTAHDYKVLSIPGHGHVIYSAASLGMLQGAFACIERYYDSQKLVSGSEARAWAL